MDSADRFKKRKLLFNMPNFMKFTDVPYWGLVYYQIRLFLLNNVNSS